MVLFKPIVKTERVPKARDVVLLTENDVLFLAPILVARRIFNVKTALLALNKH